MQLLLVHNYSLNVSVIFNIFNLKEKTVNVNFGMYGNVWQFLEKMSSALIFEGSKNSGMKIPINQ